MPRFRKQPMETGSRMLTLSAGPGQPFWCTGGLDVLFINPASENVDIAEAYLAYVAQHLPRSFSVLANPNNQYVATAEWISAYRAMVEYVLILTPGFFDSGPARPELYKNVWDVIARYEAGQVDIEYVINEFTRIERMKTLEGE